MPGMLQTFYIHLLLLLLLSSSYRFLIIDSSSVLTVLSDLCLQPLYPADFGGSATLSSDGCGPSRPEGIRMCLAFILKKKSLEWHVEPSACLVLHCRSSVLEIFGAPAIAAVRLLDESILLVMLLQLL